MGSMRYVSASIFEKNKLSLSDPFTKGNTTRINILYMYKNGEIAPLVISPGVMIKCPKGTYADTFNGMLTGRTKINAFLDHSDTNQAKMYDAIGDVYDFIHAQYNHENTTCIKFPICEAEDGSNSTMFLRFIQSNDGILHTKIFKDSKKMELPLPPCMANVGISFSFPFDKKKCKINVQFNISQMIIGEDLSQCSLDNESFDG